MKIVHISDTHGSKYHNKLEIPECDVLIHSGDVGGRTNLFELQSFIIWFLEQSATIKIFVAGNHDIVLDKFWPSRTKNNITRHILYEDNLSAKKMIKDSGIIYLENKDYVYQGIKFYGSPYTPSFHKQNWVFNADRGEEIKKEWSKIPSDTNVLITHGPPYGILDTIPENYKITPEEDVKRGCEDLINVIKKRLYDLKLCCFGHIHGNTGIIVHPVSNTRHVIFSNGAVIDNDYKQIITKPCIISI